MIVEALERLGRLADVFLLHDRRIVAPSDDSIVRMMAGEPRVMRLGRGYAPYPVALTRDPRKVLPTGCVVGWGPDLKATFAMQAGRFALISQHLGDQETLPAQAFHRRAYEHFQSVFRQQPDTIVADLHPGYHSRALAREEAEQTSARPLDAQHHHAHLASVMLENGLEGRVIALALDGTGYGTDGSVWGGEILVGDAAQYSRAGTLRTLPLPGGEAAIRHTWRLGLALVHETDVALFDSVMGELTRTPFAEDAKVVAEMLRGGVNLVPCTSLGRLFDAFSALLGICAEATYEAQAAIELEMAAARYLAETKGDVEQDVEFELAERDGMIVLDYAPLVRAALGSLAEAGMHALWLGSAYPADDPLMPLPEVSKRLSLVFIRSLASAYAEVTQRIAERERISQVVLSGGCLQNKLLLERMVDALSRRGLDVYAHSAVPMNDAGIALGQLAHGLAMQG